MAVAGFLDKLDQIMMTRLDVKSTIKAGRRKLHSTFAGIGLHVFVTEHLIE